MTSEIATPRPGTYLRALGLRERCLYVYTERNPLHFLLVAEFDISLDEHRVRDGLFAVQCRHPLLTAHIRDDPDSGPGFYRRDPVPAIDLTVRNDVEQDWQRSPLRNSPGRSTPRRRHSRATLVTHRMTSSLLLVFDHVISDGISAISVLKDLLSALNGEPLPALPCRSPWKILATRKFSPVRVEDVSLDVDPRMVVPASFAPSTPTPHIHRVTVDRSSGARREERTTVHAAIVTAASRVRNTQCGEEFVRTYSPINVRELVDQGAGCCLCISFARTGAAPADGTDFWCQAREVSNQLKIARSADGLMLGSAVIDQIFPRRRRLRHGRRVSPHDVAVRTGDHQPGRAGLAGLRTDSAPSHLGSDHPDAD